MAVTIDELHVQVEEQAPAPKATEPGAEPQKDMDLEQALEMQHERKLRLRAD